MGTQKTRNLILEALKRKAKQAVEENHEEYMVEEHWTTQEKDLSYLVKCGVELI